MKLRQGPKFYARSDIKTQGERKGDIALALYWKENVNTGPPTRSLKGVDEPIYFDEMFREA